MVHKAFAWTNWEQPKCLIQQPHAGRPYLVCKQNNFLRYVKSKNIIQTHQIKIGWCDQNECGPNDENDLNMMDFVYD